MEAKEINILYAVDIEDNVKATLFAVEGKPTKEMIKKAVSEYDMMYQEDEFMADLDKVAEEIYQKEYAFNGTDEFFFDTTTLYY